MRRPRQLFVITFYLCFKYRDPQEELSALDRKLLAIDLDRGRQGVSRSIWLFENELNPAVKPLYPLLR